MPCTYTTLVSGIGGKMPQHDFISRVLPGDRSHLAELQLGDGWCSLLECWYALGAKVPCALGSQDHLDAIAFAVFTVCVTHVSQTFRRCFAGKG